MKIKSFKIFGLLAIMLMILNACEEEAPDMKRAEGVVPSITNLNPAVFFPLDLQTTYVSFEIDAQGYTGDLVLLVSMDGDKSRNPVKTISTVPATVNVTLVEVAQAFGKTVDEIVPGSMFNFEVQTTVGGKTYRSNASFNAPLACVYDPSVVSGSYRAASTGWGVNGPISITVDPEDEFVVYVTGLAALDGLNEDLGPLKMVINPADFTVSAERTALATEVWLGYTHLSYAGTGVLDSCTGVYRMSFTITVSAGSYGSYAFTLSPN
jgi:hypothetical protein